MMSAKDEVEIFRMTRVGKRTALIRTTEEYAGQTTIHGINYIFDKKFNLAERVFWLLLVLSFFVLATYLTWNTWTQWREEQVVTMLMMIIKMTLMIMMMIITMTMMIMMMSRL